MSIEVLYPNPDDIDLNVNLSLDIIAIHGINGDRLRTWTEPKSKKLWLRDILRLDLPRARIMTFGYDATAAVGNSAADITDHARDLLTGLVEKREHGDELKRPLIFVGHSLGGLVIKQALIIAAREDPYKHIYFSTNGIIFFGTPHQGSSLATYAAILARISTAVALKPDSELLQSLKMGCEALANLKSEFETHHKMRPYDIVSFYETKTMRGFPFLIVEKESAILTPPGDIPTFESQYPVDSTHRDLCRFSSPKDKTYKTFVRSVKRIYEGSHTSEIRNEYYVVPHTASPHFTGRNDIRQRLSDCLISNHFMRLRAQQRFVLYGLGGSGKTQMCLKFAEDHCERFWGIFWIDASSTETAKESFLKIARTCKQEEDVDSIKAWLSGKGDWLLIIDNADDPSLDISNFFPAGRRGTVLITTRNPDCQKHSSAGSCKVDEMHPKDAASLLLKTAAIESTEPTIISAKRVVKVLGYLALAIIQAGAVIRQQLCSLDGFCELYLQQKKDLLESGRPQTGIDYQYSVYTTWEISIRKIEQMQEEHAKYSLELLSLFSFMHFDGISEDIFKNARMNEADFLEGCLFSTTSTYKRMPSGWNPLVLAKALKTLVEFSLITIDESRRISMHPLVHQWSRERMREDDLERIWGMTASTLAMSISVRFTFLDYQDRRRLLPHVDACLAPNSMFFFPGPHLLERLAMADKFALVYQENGRYKQAIDLQVECLRVKQFILPSEHPSILSSMHGLALSFSCLDRFQESVNLRETLLKFAVRTSGSKSLEALEAMHNLAFNYESLGQYQRQLDLMTEVLSGFRAAFGEENQWTLAAKVGLAGCFYNLKRFKEAARLSEQVLDVYRRTLGELHFSTLRIMDNLSTYYAAIKQHKKSRKLRDQALASMKLTLGEDHPWTLVTRLHSVSRAGRRQQVAVRREVLQNLRGTQGELSLWTLHSISNLAQSYMTYGCLEKARILQKEALNGMIEVLGEGHPRTVFHKQYLILIERAIILRKAVYWWVPRKLMYSVMVSQEPP